MLTEKYMERGILNLFRMMSSLWAFIDFKSENYDIQSFPLEEGDQEVTIQDLAQEEL